MCFWRREPFQWRQGPRRLLELNGDGRDGTNGNGGVAVGPGALPHPWAGLERARAGNLGRGRHALAVEVNGRGWVDVPWLQWDGHPHLQRPWFAWRAWEQARCLPLGCLRAVHFPLIGGGPRVLEEAGTTEGLNAPVDDARSRPWARCAPPLPDPWMPGCVTLNVRTFFSRPLPTRWTLRCENLNGPFEDNTVCTKGVASSPNLPGHPRCREPIHLSTRPPVRPSIHPSFHHQSWMEPSKRTPIGASGRSLAPAHSRPGSGCTHDAPTRRGPFVPLFAARPLRIASCTFTRRELVTRCEDMFLRTCNRACKYAVYENPSPQRHV